MSEPLLVKLRQDLPANSNERTNRRDPQTIVTKVKNETTDDS